MNEPTLGDLLANLTEAVSEYQGVVNRMFEVHSQRIDLCDRMVTELRDDTHEANTAIGNRLETLTRAFMVDAAEVAQKMVNDSQRRAVLREVSRDSD